MAPEPRVVNPRQDPVSPREHPPQCLDTPYFSLRRNEQMADPSYEPPDSPRSRLEPRSTRDGPPVTRLQSNVQALRNAVTEHASD
jgi:hypothetical protein